MLSHPEGLVDHSDIPTTWRAGGQVGGRAPWRAFAGGSRGRGLLEEEAYAEAFAEALEASRLRAVAKRAHTS